MIERQHLGKRAPRDESVPLVKEQLLKRVELLVIILEPPPMTLIALHVGYCCFSCIKDCIKL